MDRSGDEPKGLTETEVGDVTARLTQLGLNPVEGVCILPMNFLHADSPTELFYTPATPDIKILLREADVALDKIEPAGVKIPFRDDRDSTLILPALFFGAALLAKNPHLLNVAYGVLANYVTDYFRGRSGTNRVKCSVFVEKTDKKKRRRKSNSTPILKTWRNLRTRSAKLLGEIHHVGID